MPIKVFAKSSGKAEIRIYDPIGDSFWGDSVSAKKVAKDLDELGDVQEIDVRINSPGGAVWDGFAIYNLLKQHPADVHVYVDGVAASIASVIAMSGDQVTMGEGAIIMVHSPWTFAIGNSAEMRGVAEMLDKVEVGIIDAYQHRTGMDRAEITAMVKAETWLTADEAIEHGFADDRAEMPEEEEEEDRAAAASWAPILSRFHDVPAELTARYRTGSKKRAQAFRKNDAFNAEAIRQCAAMVTSAPPAHTLVLNIDARGPQDADAIRKQILSGLRATAAITQSAPADAPSLEDDMPDQAPASVQLTDTQKAANAAAEAAKAAERKRIADLSELCAKHQMPQEFVNACITDGSSYEQVGQKVLAAKYEQQKGQPNPLPHAEISADEKDKLRAAASEWLVARAGLGKHDAANPFRGMTIADVARECLEANGVRTRGMGRDAVIKAAITHSTGDFPNIYENALHKSMLSGFQVAAPTWPRFCRTGSLSDFRPHLRYRAGSFSDLLPVLENGEYKDGTIGDAERESITAVRKGRILNISREMLVNDDMSAFSGVSNALGQAAARTLDKDVYALFAENSAAGPTMGDGDPLFHTNHANIVSSGTAPTMAAFEAMRVQMASQKDPSNNDYLDIRPAVWLGPLSLGGQARQTNSAEYDDESQKNQRKPNISRGLIQDIVDTPRLPATVWYMLADPAVEPVIEVGFLDGVQVPQLDMEEAFRSDGMAWRIRYEYGVAAIGWRGALKNPGQ